MSVPKKPEPVSVELEGSLIVDGISKQSFSSVGSDVNKSYKLALVEHGVVIEGTRDKKLVPWPKVKSVTLG